MAHRISFLVPYAFGMGGIPRAVFKLGGELAERGHEVEVVSVVRQIDEPFFPVHPGIRLDALLDLRDPGSRDGVRPRPRQRSRWTREGRLDRRPTALAADGHQLFSELTDRLLRARVEQVRSGVIVATRPELAVGAVRWARPGVVTVLQEMNSIVDRGPGLQHALRDSARPGAGRSLDAFLTLTDAELAKWVPVLGETSTHLEAIPAPNSFALGPAAPLDTKTVVAAGRLTRQKGFDLLIRAWRAVAREHPDWRLDIYGRGPLRSRLQELIEQHGLQGSVRLQGASSEMEQVLGQASVFALSSRFEGFGLVIVEAMSKGVPVVSFDCPEGPAMLIEDEVTGLLIPDGDVAKLSEGLRRLIQDDELRARIGHAGLQRAADYDVRLIADRWEELLDELVRRRTTTSR